MLWITVCIFASLFFVAYLQEQINKNLMTRIEELEKRLGLRE